MPQQPQDEEKFVHSLFRCMNWDAKGGKSNSQFRKTMDNRFVLKEMSKQEVQSFFVFAPQYIQYVTDCVQNKVNIEQIISSFVSFLLNLMQINLKN
jgi:hypothetical protein